MIEPVRGIVLMALVAACSFRAPHEVAAGHDADVTTDDGARPDAPDAPPDAPPPDFHLRIEVLVDGRSNLIVQGTTVQWQHYQFAAPGRLDFVMEPTTLNGTPWFPIWPDEPTIENRDCNGCMSSIGQLAAGVPGVPSVPSTTTLTEVQVRRPQQILQEPTAANDYTLIVEITDVGEIGGAPYIVEVDVAVN
jgi:hypothetical protein